MRPIFSKVVSGAATAFDYVMRMMWIPLDYFLFGERMVSLPYSEMRAKLSPHKDFGHVNDGTIMAHKLDDVYNPLFDYHHHFHEDGSHCYRLFQNGGFLTYDGDGKIPVISTSFSCDPLGGPFIDVTL